MNKHSWAYKQEMDMTPQYLNGKLGYMPMVGLILCSWSTQLPLNYDHIFGPKSTHEPGDSLYTRFSSVTISYLQMNQLDIGQSPPFYQSRSSGSQVMMKQLMREKEMMMKMRREMLNQVKVCCHWRYCQPGYSSWFCGCKWRRCK